MASFFCGALNVAEQELAKLLVHLPDDALVPVGWLRAQLRQPDAVQADGVGDLSCADVAKMLSRTPGCIRGWCKSGEFARAYRLNGREWRIPRASLRAYLDAHGSKKSAQTAEPINLGRWRK